RADNSALGNDDMAVQYPEEPGAVIQVSDRGLEDAQQARARHQLGHCSHVSGTVTAADEVVFSRGDKVVLSDSRPRLRCIWAETTYEMQALRDTPEGAKQEFAAKADAADPGLNVKLSFDINQDVAGPFILKGAAPRVAI